MTRRRESFMAVDTDGIKTVVRFTVDIAEGIVNIGSTADITIDQWQTLQDRINSVIFDEQSKQTVD